MNISKKIQNTIRGDLQFLLVSGKTGSGITTAIKSLEEIGFYALRNIPFDLIYTQIDALLDIKQPICIGFGSITLGWNKENIQKLCVLLSKKIPNKFQSLYLDCREDILIRRFSQTRRKHPLDPNLSLKEAFEKEEEILCSFKKKADYILNTCFFQEKDLKAFLHNHFLNDKHSFLVIQILSFSYKNGLPMESDIVFDVRFLKNPYYQDELKDLTGLDEKIADYILSDRNFDVFFNKFSTLISDLIGLYKDEKKGYLTISIGCTGGKHRSVYVAKKLAEQLESEKNTVILKHLNL